MSSVVLYRKYRPKTFSEVVGQEHVVRTLANAISRGMLSHAYLFAGPRGSGKTTLARLLAKAVNCQNRPSGKGFEPCNACSSCQEINEGRAMDLIEIDAASNRGIDEIRELRDAIRFVPSKSKYKVFIVDEAHQLTKEAVNALLKTLEEPPAHAIFVFATTEAHKMISTLISRCQRFDLRMLTLPEITGKLERILKEEGIKAESAALELIALNSGGSVRDAESLLNQVLTFSGALDEKTLKAETIKDLLGMVDINVVAKLMDLFVEKKAAQTLDFLNQTVEKGSDPHELAKTIIHYFRQALLMKISPEFKNPILTGLTGEQRQKLQSQIANLKESDISRALHLFLDAEYKMRYSPIPQLPLELAIVELIGPKE